MPEPIIATALGLLAFIFLGAGAVGGMLLRDWQRGRWESWDFPGRPDR